VISTDILFLLFDFMGPSGRAQTKMVGPRSYLETALQSANSLQCALHWDIHAARKATHRGYWEHIESPNKSPETA